jgi:hypothetical protein
MFRVSYLGTWRFHRGFLIDALLLARRKYVDKTASEDGNAKCDSITQLAASGSVMINQKEYAGV